MNSDQKRKKFVDLANKRVNKLLNQISLIGNLSNTSNYEYTKDEVKQIMTALENAIQQCKERFNTSKGQKIFCIR